MVFVTHDMSVHANMADRVGIIYAGRLVEEGADARSCSLRPSIPIPRIWSPACRASATRRSARRWKAGRPTSPSRRPAAASIRAARWRIDKCKTRSAAARDRGQRPPHRLLALATTSSRWSAPISCVRMG